MRRLPTTIRHWKWTWPLVVVLLLAAVAQACPNCKEALASSDPQQQNMVRGYFYSILFMMSMPFLILGSFSSYMYLEVRRARAAKAKEQQSGDDAHEQR